MSRFVMIVLGVGLAIGCVAFACLLKWHDRSSWGWFLLIGFFWVGATEEHDKWRAEPRYDPRRHPLADGELGFGKKYVEARRS